LWFGLGGRPGAAHPDEPGQSCKELGINPLVYLRDVLRAVATTPANRVHELTPKGWKRNLEERVAAQELSHRAITAVVSKLTFAR
jgi:hypothetical protein